MKEVFALLGSFYPGTTLGVVNLRRRQQRSTGLENRFLASYGSRNTRKEEGPVNREPTHPQSNKPIPDKVYQLAKYLWEHPDDLIDASQLLHRYQVSVEEFHHAFALLEV
jgi:hypothetical protein